MPKFKIGDRVIVKERTYGAFDYQCSYVDGMISEVGTIHTITSVYEDKVSHAKIQEEDYYYKISNNTYDWSSTMLELVKPLKSKFNVGDKVKVVSKNQLTKCNWVIEEMMEYADQEAKITLVEDPGTDMESYHLNIGRPWHWHPKTLIKIEDFDSNSNLSTDITITITKKIKLDFS